MEDLSSYSDENLVKAIKSAHVAAFKELYDRYYKALFHFLWLRTNSTELAKDFVQEIFARIWEIRQKLDSKKSIKAYLYRIANNLVIDYFRKKSS